MGAKTTKWKVIGWQDIHTDLKSYLAGYFLITRRWRHYLNQCLSITNNTPARHFVPPDMIQKEVHDITYVGFLAKTFHLNLIVRKQSDKYILGDILHDSWLGPFKKWRGETHRQRISTLDYRRLKASELWLDLEPHIHIPHAQQFRTLLGQLGKSEYGLYVETESMLNFWGLIMWENVIIVSWLCKKMSLFLGDLYWSTRVTWYLQLTFRWSSPCTPQIHIYV